MEKLEQLMKSIADDFEFPFEKSADGQTCLLECMFGNGRTQVVSGTTFEDKGQKSYVFFTVVGKHTPDMDLTELIKRQMVWKSAKIGILGDDLIVCSALDPETMLGPEGRRLVEQALQDISIHGDMLEDELFGGVDVN